MPRSSTKNRDGSSDLGQLAEALVAEWLTRQGYEVLQRRWHCRWGELDLVALEGEAIAPPSPSPRPFPASPQPPNLVFVEVKARNGRNWDENGLLAITPQKQAKLWQAAELFLAAFPDLATLPCRFDLALVRAQARPLPPRLLQSTAAVAAPSISAVDQKFAPVCLGQPVAIAQYRLTLQHYLKNVLTESFSLPPQS